MRKAVNSPLERHLQKTCLDYLKWLKARDPALAFRKRHGSAMQTAGDPDLYGVWHGIPFEFELKRPGHTLTLLQASRLQEWAQAGAVTAVVRSFEDLKAALTEVQQKINPR
jgi:hypothetical protein